VSTKVNTILTCAGSVVRFNDALYFDVNLGCGKIIVGLKDVSIESRLFYIIDVLVGCCGRHQ